MKRSYVYTGKKKFLATRTRKLHFPNVEKMNADGKGNKDNNDHKDNNEDRKDDDDVRKDNNAGRNNDLNVANKDDSKVVFKTMKMTTTMPTKMKKKKTKTTKTKTTMFLRIAKLESVATVVILVAF